MLRRRRDRGSVLLDAMFGMFILVIAALVYSGTMGMAAVSRAKADEFTKATSIVNRELESIKNLGYDNLTHDALAYYSLISPTPGASPYSFTSVGDTNDRISTLLRNGVGTVAVTDESGTLRKVVVTVSWTARTGAESATASTELARLK
jgi:hypothetical protein